MEHLPGPPDPAPDGHGPDMGAAGVGAAGVGGDEHGLEVDLDTLASIESELDAVELALHRLDDGSYGRCDVCEAPLGEAELAAVPTARFCPAHLPISLG